MSVTFNQIREVALNLPGVTEGRSQGNTPSLHVNKKFIGWLLEDKQQMVLRVNKLDREMMIAAEPQTFSISDHYTNTPYVLVNIDQISPEAIRALIERAWKEIASKKLQASSHSL